MNLKKNILWLLLLWSLILHAQINTPYQYIDTRPHGGWKEFREFVKHEMVYPESELKNEREGVVVLQFTVKEDGEVSHVTVIQSAGPAMDREAQRIFRKVLWIPAIEDEGAVQATKTIDFPFEVKKYRKWVKRRGFETPPYPHRPVDTTDFIYDVHETTVPPKPLFRDTTQGIYQYISQHLKYPDEAYRRNIHGKVTVQFVIEQDGSISNIHPVQPLGGGCTEEATRLLKLIKWHPAINEGMAVRTFMQLDVIFVLPAELPGSG